MTASHHTTDSRAAHAQPRQSADGFRLDGHRPPLREVLAAAWASRSLIAILARKDFYVRYRRATFGLLWAAALPLLQACALAFVVSRFAEFDTGGDYVVFVLSGTVAWSTFGAILNTGSTAVVDGAGLSTKIYFPRLVLPLTSVWTGAYGLAISVVVLLGGTVISGVGLGWRTFLLAPAAGLLLLLGASFVLVLSALHVYFRDVRYLVQASLLVWLYVTPVIYPLSAIGGLRPWVEANPVTGVVEMFRAATIGGEPGWTTSVWWTGGWCAALLAIGIALHRRFDRVFVDLI